MHEPILTAFRGLRLPRPPRQGAGGGGSWAAPHAGFTHSGTTRSSLHPNISRGGEAAVGGGAPPSPNRNLRGEGRGGGATAAAPRGRGAAPGGGGGGARGAPPPARGSSAPSAVVGSVRDSRGPCNEAHRLRSPGQLGQGVVVRQRGPGAMVGGRSRCSRPGGRDLEKTLSAQAKRYTSKNIVGFFQTGENHERKKNSLADGVQSIAYLDLRGASVHWAVVRPTPRCSGFQILRSMPAAGYCICPGRHTDCCALLPRWCGSPSRRSVCGIWRVRPGIRARSS